jgi:pantetheine-phosphate adenylyltransferase
MKTLSIYPGTFDPVTVGHLDIIRRACGVFSKVIVAVAADSHKQALFSVEERVEMVRRVTIDLERVAVESFSGLLVDYMRSRQAQVALRGLRAFSDFEYEFQIAQMNRKLFKEFEIVYMMPDEKYTYISSTLVKEIGSLSGDITSLVPSPIHDLVTQKLKMRRTQR